MRRFSTFDHLKPESLWQSQVDSSHL
jgi:hypothetical protein